MVVTLSRNQGNLAKVLLGKSFNATILSSSAKKAFARLPHPVQNESLSRLWSGC